MDTINPTNVIAPIEAVAERTIAIISDLAVLRQAEGREAAQVEAMAMHNAAVAVLRPDIGPEGVRRMLLLAAEENERVEARDAETVEVGRRRAERSKRLRKGAPT